MISSFRALLYKSGLLKTTELPGTTVSVGNLSLGGTGKSPFVILLAQMALAKNVGTVVLTRGYKRKSKSLELVKAGEPLPPVGRLGDEPWMIRHRLPGLNLLVHRDRARMLVRHWADLGKPKLILLDDGFQHWKATRDRDVLMIDVSESLDQRTIPFGRLRESEAAVARADLIVLTRAGSVPPEKLAELEGRLRAITTRRRQPLWKRGQAAHVRIVAADYEFQEYFGGPEGRACDLPKNAEFVLATGVAKPDGVRALAKKLGVNVKEEIYFPDHHRLSSRELESLQKAVQGLQNGAILTTEKDWARWHEPLKNLPVYGMRVAFRFHGEGEAEVKAFLEEALSST